jgi:hypothetical protein
LFWKSFASSFFSWSGVKFLAFLTSGISISSKFSVLVILEDNISSEKQFPYRQFFRCRSN